MVTVQLSEEQVKYLLGLIDLAIKSGGIQVAEGGVVLTKIIQEAMKVSQFSPPPGELFNGIEPRKT